jgi:hypothetical protein
MRKDEQFLGKVDLLRPLGVGWRTLPAMASSDIHTKTFNVLIEIPILFLIQTSCKFLIASLANIEKSIDAIH